MTGTPPESVTTERTRRELIAWRNAIFTIFFLSGLSLASWVARLPAIRDDVGLSTQGVGFVILAGSAASVIGLIVAPWVMARFGTRLGMAGVLRHGDGGRGIRGYHELTGARRNRTRSGAPTQSRTPPARDPENNEVYR